MTVPLADPAAFLPAGPMTMMIPFVIMPACHAAALAAAVWVALAALGDRVPAAWRCGLWLVVLARLAVPLAGPIAVAAPAFLARPAPVAVPDEPAVSAPAAAPERPRPAAFARPESPAAKAPIGPVPRVPPVPRVRRSTVRPVAVAVDWRAWVAAVWAAGAAWGLGRLLVGTVRLRRAARGWPDVTDPAARAVLAGAKAAAGVRGPVRWVRSPVGPAVFGAGRPTVLLPADVLADPAALRLAALHELAHVRRRDVGVGVMTSVVRCLWWPHPAAHLAACRWRADRELACDAAVLAALSPAERPAYGRLVIDLLARPRGAAAPAVAAGLFSPFPPLKRRIKAMTRFTPPTRPRRALAAALLCGLTACALVRPTPAAPPDGAATEPPAETTTAVAPNEAPADAAPVTLAGTVRGPDGKPRAGVRVVLTAADGPFYGTGHTTKVGETTTGEDGAFRFADLPPLTPKPAEMYSNDPPTGRWFYGVTAAADGLATTTVIYRRPGDWPPQIANPPGAPVEMRLEMPRAVSLSGAVVDAGGAPIAGARVTSGRSSGDAPDPLAEFRSAVTGPDGGFTIDDLAPWDAEDTLVRTGPSTFMRSGGLPFEAVADGYSPTRIDVESIPSEEFVRFELTPAGALRGVVVDSVTGEPAAGVRIAAQATTYPIDPDGTPDTTRSNPVYDWGHVLTDESGRYEISPLSPTTYNVLLLETLPDRAAAALAAVRVAPGEPTEAPPMRLVRGGLLVGRFLDADGEPIARVPYKGDDWFGGEPPPNPPEVDRTAGRPVRPVPPEICWGPPSSPADVGPDGRFSFRVPPGRQFPYIMVRRAADAEWVLRPWMEAGIPVGEGEVVEIVYQLQGPGPNPEPPDGLRFPTPAEPDRAAAAAVRGFGGFYDLNEDGRVVAVDLVSHAPPPGARTRPNLRLDRGQGRQSAGGVGGRRPGARVAAGTEVPAVLAGGSSDDDDLAAVGLSPSLEDRSPRFGSTEGSVTDAGMIGLARAKTLKSVWFSRSGADGRERSRRSPVCRTWTYLNLFGNTFTDAGVTPLAGAASLQTLILGSRRSDPDDGRAGASWTPPGSPTPGRGRCTG